MGAFSSEFYEAAREKILGPRETSLPEPSHGGSSGVISARGIGDQTPLNDRLNDPSNWKGTDDDVWYMRWRIAIKSWFAFSNKSPEGLAWSLVLFPGTYLLPFTIWFTGWSWWYLFPIAVIPVTRKWRDRPKVILSFKWGGQYRWESMGDEPDVETNTIIGGKLHPNHYFSRIQDRCKGLVAVVWPLCFFFHWGKIFLYRGWHFDDDLIFWGDGGAGPFRK